MYESPRAYEQVVGRLQVGLTVLTGASVASRTVEFLTENELERLAGRSSLGSGLAQITARLLDQLATGGARGQDGAVATAARAQRDIRGNRVPWDQIPLVSWKRVVAVSAGGSLLALVSLPLSA